MTPNERKVSTTDLMSKIPDGWVEIVAVPGSESVPSPKKIDIGDTRYSSQIDEDGIHHFRLPKETAAHFLENSGGMKFILVGGEDSLTFPVRRGLYSEMETAKRYTKRHTSHGVVQWIPVEVEGPSNEG